MYIALGIDYFWQENKKCDPKVCKVAGPSLLPRLIVEKFSDQDI